MISTRQKMLLGLLSNLGRATGPAFTTGLTKANTSVLRATYLAGTRNAIIAHIGDSLDAGQSTGGGTSQFVNGWGPKMATKLAARGIPSAANNLWGTKAFWGLASTIANYETGDSRMAHTGAGWATGGTLTAGGHWWQTSATGANTITFQGPITNIDFWWRDNSTGRSFSYQVDGGAATQVDSTNVDALRKVSITGLTKGTHSITYNWVLGTPVVIGFDAYDATRKEISVWNWGASGFNSNQMVATAGASCSQLSCIAALKPDLAFIEGGVYNDLQQSIALATTKANLTTLVQAVLAAGGNACMRVPPWLQTFTSAQQQPTISMMYDVARENGIGIWDITRKPGWTSYADEVANSLVSDFVHPNVAGYDNQADTGADIIQWAIAA